MIPSIRSLFDSELANINDMIIEMASMVQQAITKAFDALATNDVELAQEVILGDNEVNRLRFEIEEKAQLVLATQQPAAGDLRFILAAGYIANELERVGDHAAGIGRIVLRLQEVPATGLDWSRLPKMTKRAVGMLELATTAFADRDVDKAWKLVKRDRKLDKHYRKFFGEAVTQMSAEDKVEMATFMLWVAHNLERIGDRATNMAERVIFMETGEYTEIHEDYY